MKQWINPLDHHGIPYTWKTVGVNNLITLAQINAMCIIHTKPESVEVKIYFPNFKPTNIQRFN